jgi:hypothetical protein
MLIVACPQVSWLAFGRELFHNAVDGTVEVTLALNRLLR